PATGLTGQAFPTRRARPGRTDPGALRSEHLGGERDDLHELLGAQLTGHRPEDAGAERLQVLVDQDRGVAVELDEAPVRATHALRGADDHGLCHVTLLHLAVEQDLAAAYDNDVAYRRVLTLRAPEHLDAIPPLRARVVGHVEHAGHLDHCSLFLRPSGPTDS